MLPKEEVLNISELARISLNEDEIEKYRKDLKTLLDEVEKINEIEGYDDEILIAPWSEDSKLRKDEEGQMLSPQEVIKNAPHHAGNYIEVPKVVGGEVSA